MTVEFIVISYASIVCVGGRLLLWEDRRTGNPVQFRDGPRRCNRVLDGSSNLLAIVELPGRHSRRYDDEKAGQTELGSQKTYQR